MNPTIKFLCVILLILHTSLSTNAQYDSTKIKRLRTVWGFGTNIRGVDSDLSNLNAILIKSGFPALNSGYVGVGFELTTRARDRGTYLSIGLNSLFARPDYNNSNLLMGSEIRSFEFRISSHFNLINSRKWLLYPYYSIGMTNSTLTVYKKTDNSGSVINSISTVTNPDYYEKNYTAFPTPFFELGGGLERKFFNGFYIGLNGGYKLSGSQRYFEKYQTLSDSPKVSLSGLAINFKLRLELREILRWSGERFREKGNRDWN